MRQGSLKKKKHLKTVFHGIDKYKFQYSFSYEKYYLNFKEKI